MKSVQKEFRGQEFGGRSAKEKERYIKYDLVKSIYGNYKFLLNGTTRPERKRLIFFQKRILGFSTPESLV